VLVYGNGLHPAYASYDSNLLGLQPRRPATHPNAREMASLAAVRPVCVITDRVDPGSRGCWLSGHPDRHLDQTPTGQALFSFTWTLLRYVLALESALLVQPCRSVVFEPCSAGTATRNGLRQEYDAHG
jgi:hypothetical protein